MRTIKFRVRLRDKKTYKIMVDIVTLDELFERNGCYWGCVGGWEIISKDEFTGLLDKNGKEIYEGDIDNRGFVVEYLVGMSGYYLMKNEEGFHLSHEQIVLNNKLRNIEIIGNIYEHQALLKGGK